MQTAKQFSVSLVNKPGRLADLLATLSKEKVGLRALTVMDSGERGTLRMVPDDFALASEILDRINIRFDADGATRIDHFWHSNLHLAHLRE